MLKSAVKWNPGKKTLRYRKNPFFIKLMSKFNIRMIIIKVIEELKFSLSMCPNKEEIVNTSSPYQWPRFLTFKKFSFYFIHKNQSVCISDFCPNDCTFALREKCPNWPVEQKCLTTNIVYKAKVTSSNQNYQEKVYFDSCKTTFKKRFSNHKKSFNLNEYKNETELSNEIWRIKNSCHHPKVKWEIVKKCVPYNTQTKHCLLCLNEKLEIAAYKEQNLLNKRNEIVSKYRHQLKYTPGRYDTKD